MGAAASSRGARASGDGLQQPQQQSAVTGLESLLTRGWPSVDVADERVAAEASPPREVRAQGTAAAGNPTAARSMAAAAPTEAAAPAAACTPPTAGLVGSEETYDRLRHEFLLLDINPEEGLLLLCVCAATRIAGA